MVRDGQRRMTTVRLNLHQLMLSAKCKAKAGSPGRVRHKGCRDAPPRLVASMARQRATSEACAECRRRAADPAACQPAMARELAEAGASLAAIPHELGRLRSRLARGEVCKSDYAAQVVELRRRYPLVSLRVALWADVE